MQIVCPLCPTLRGLCRRLPALGLFLMAVSLTAACADDRTEGDHLIELPIHLSIPASEGPHTKALGDPGTYEKFRLPRYAYIYCVIEKTDGTTQVYTLQQELTGTWTPSTLGSGLLTEGDSVYNYTGRLAIMLPAGSDRSAGRVYAAVSYEPLTTLTGDETTESGVKDLRFTVTDALRSELQNLYSSPYNYENSYGDYYGTIDHITENILTVRLLLYHVAAKVDLRWNVAQAAQSAFRVTSLQAAGLYGGPCYLFRPMENGSASTTYDLELLSTYTGDAIGSQWLGRRYFYTIPSYSAGNTFDIHTTWQKNGDTSGRFHATFQNTKPSIHPEFTPWVRGDITFNADVAYNSEGEVVYKDGVRQ